MKCDTQYGTDEEKILKRESCMDSSE